MNNKIIPILLVGLFCLSMVSAHFWDPFHWFHDEEIHDEVNLVYFGIENDIINKTLPSGTKINIQKISTTSECLIDCSFTFRIKLNESKTINDLSKFKPKFYNYMGDNSFYDYNFELLKNITYQKEVYDYGIVEHILPSSKIDSYNIIGNSTSECEIGVGSIKNEMYINFKEIPDYFEDDNYIVCYDRKNTSGIYWNATSIIGSHMEEFIKLGWTDFNPLEKTIQADKWYYLNINAKRKAMLGEQSVDMVPDLLDHEFIEFDWFNSSWLYSKNITLNTSLIEGSHIDFPIVINITDCDLNKSQADGDDILFTDITGTTQLKHEIEYWNTTSCELRAFVKMPVLNITENELQIYYGNALATNQQNIHEVWNGSYLFVYHFQETNITDGGTGNIKDSTINVNNGTTNNMVDADQVPGKIDGSLDFDGAAETDYIDIEPFGNYTYTNFTFEVWYKSTLTEPVDDEYFYRTKAADSFDIVSFAVSNDPGTPSISETRLIVNDGGGPTLTYGTSNISDQEWHHLVATRTFPGNVSIVVDGIVETNVVVTEGTPIVVDPEGPYIGDDPGNTKQIDGIIDEFRMSDIYRSLDWIVTSYNSQVNINAFHTFSAEETVTDTTPPTYSDITTNSTVAGQTTNFSIQWNDETALHPNGQYIFSTNNTGVWVNDSAVNFTATPSAADVIKDLNSTEGLSIGYRWYATDNAGNENDTGIQVLTTTAADTCNPTSPLTSNYNYDCSDNCTQSTALNAATYNISFTGSGLFRLLHNITFGGTNQHVFIESECEIQVESGSGFI